MDITEFNEILSMYFSKFHGVDYVVGEDIVVNLYDELYSLSDYANISDEQITAILREHYVPEFCDSVLIAKYRHDTEGYNATNVDILDATQRLEVLIKLLDRS